MTHGSLFSGIGGFELAAEWMGWENKFHCEWNEFGQKVLHHYWPESEQFTDITKSNFTKYANKIDILTGGFPCQPYSSAGKRLGKDDERHLWPEMLRAIREINPTYIVGENVRGLLNWNGGMVFHEVCAELETNGYEVAPCLIPACSVNAPHQRQRIWFIAYSKSNGCEKRGKRINKWQINKLQNRSELWDKFTTNGKESNATNSNSNGQHRSDSKYEVNSSERREYAFSNIEQNDIKHTKNIRSENALEYGELEKRRFGQSNQRTTWNSFPSVTPICVGDDGLSDRLDAITFSKWRNESIKAAGNAIVPQVALQIFKAIEQYDKAHGCKP
jgi:DNA (cytosine-5)-methyltransferase 1